MPAYGYSSVLPSDEENSQRLRPALPGRFSAISFGRPVHGSGGRTIDAMDEGYVSASWSSLLVVFQFRVVAWVSSRRSKKLLFNLVRP